MISFMTVSASILFGVFVGWMLFGSDKTLLTYLNLAISRQARLIQRRNRLITGIRNLLDEYDSENKDREEPEDDEEDE